VKEASQRTGKAYRELEQRLEREEQLAVLQRKMEVRALLRGGRNRPERLIQEETKTAAPVYLWPKERKK
jgi:U3 small nucleolar RNA-associated protein 11